MAATEAKQRARTWDDCEVVQPSLRVAIKEQAVEDAVPFLNQLAEKIQTALDSCHGAAQAGDTALKELAEWVLQKNKVTQQHQDFEFLVGVAGTTGAGKTSLLNAILGFQEFLPSSCEQAATAVVCQVSWNYDYTPGHEYRAEVEFHTIEDVLVQVQDFFTAMGVLKEVNEADYENEDERIDDATQAQDGIDKYLDQIQAIWGLGQQELENMTIESLTATNPAVLQLLGKTMCLYESDPEVLSQKVQPYLDSTKHTHGEGSQAFAAWPLVKQVRQYLRADILKHGIKLVDLPGLSDMSDSRAAVAESFYTKLNVTMIVAPIIRAADEKTAGSLLNERQELRLKMDGKFNKNGFGFILSKVDDMIVEAFVRRSKDGSQVKNVHGQVKILKKDLAGIEAQLKAGQKKLQSLRRLAEKKGKMVEKIRKRVQEATINQYPQMEQRLTRNLQQLAEARQAAQTQRESIRQLMQMKANENRKRSHLGSSLVFECTSSRSRHVIDRIQTEFAQRQWKFRAARRSDSEPDLKDAGKIEVIPVSSVAFWQLKDHGPPLPGFPRENYTGVPLVKKWLKDSMVEDREEHLNNILNEFSKLINWIHQWSRNHDEKTEITYTRMDVEETLVKIHDKYEKIMNLHFRDAYKLLEEVDPLRKSQYILKECQKESSKIFARWSLKFPENPNSMERMHWLTYQANLRRGGKKYKSSGGHKVEYHWVEQLALPVMSLIANDWNAELNVKLPKKSDKAVRSFNIVWPNYFGDVTYTLRSLNADLADHFTRIIPALDPIKQTVNSGIKSTFRSISKDAATYHPRILGDLEKSIKPIFDTALRIKGHGCYAERRAIVSNDGAARSEEMFQATLDRMQNDINQSKARVPTKFKNLTVVTINSVKRHISAILESLLPPGEEGVMSQSRKINLQKDIQMVSAQWQTLWAMPIEYLIEDCADDVAIPEIFDEAIKVEEDGEFGGGYSDDSDEDEDEDMSECE